MEAVMKQIQHQLKQKDEQIAASERQLVEYKKEREELQKTIQILSATSTNKETKKDDNKKKDTAKEPIKEKTESVNEKQKWHEIVEEEAKQNENEEKQKWYVIFNGPFKGIYRDWSIANAHIAGKNVTHKSYTNKNEAEEALRASYKTVTTEAMESSSSTKTYHTLSRISSTKMDQIISTKEKEALKAPSAEKFAKLWQSLIHYEEIHTTMGFYPKYRRPGPKAVFLPGAEPLTIWDYFIHGFIDTVYIDGTTLNELKEFPLKLQLIVKTYKERFAKGRELFIKMQASYPFFDEQSQLLVSTIAVGQLGVSNEQYPTRDELPEASPTKEHLISALAGVYLSSSRIGNGKDQKAKIRINYCSKTFLLYSNYHEEINQAGIEAINLFEEPFEDFNGQLQLLPEELKKQICQIILNAPRHKCKYCPENQDEAPMMDA